MENSAKRYRRIVKAQSESSTNASTSRVSSTAPQAPPSKNGILKPASKRAAKTGLSAKMKKRPEEEKRLDDAIKHEADIPSPGCASVWKRYQDSVEQSRLIVKTLIAKVVAWSRWRF